MASRLITSRLAQAQRSRGLSTAVQFERYGLPNRVLAATTGTPIPSSLGASEVAVKMLASPIAMDDILGIAGYTSKGELPATAGNFGVGRVTGVGADVATLRVGDTVIPTIVGAGTWRNEMVQDASALAKLPAIAAELPVEQLAALGPAPLTAAALLSTCSDLQSGDWIIQNAGDGAVARAVVKLCKGSVHTLTVVPSGSSYADIAKELRESGGDMVVEEGYTGTAEFRRLISDLNGFKVALNGAGGASVPDMARVLSEGGELVTYGSTSRKNCVTVSTSALVGNGIGLRGFSLSRWLSANAHTSAGQDLLESLVKDMKVGRFAEEVTTIPFADWQRAVADGTTTADGRTVVMLM